MLQDGELFHLESDILPMLDIAPMFGPGVSRPRKELVSPQAGLFRPAMENATRVGLLNLDVFMRPVLSAIACKYSPGAGLSIPV